MDVVKIEKLCKMYQLGTFQLFALCDIDLIIQEGQYIAVMGQRLRKIHTA